MKIAQVCPRFYPYIGGVETHVQEISTRLVEKGLGVEVLTTDPSGKLLKEEFINSLRIRRFRSWAPSEAFYFSWRLRRHLLECSEDYDIVHAHSYHAFPALYAAQAKRRNKLVFTPTYHGSGHTFFRSMLHIPYKFFAKKIFEKADKVICVSNYERDLVTNHLRVGKEKVAVVPNGIDLEEFRHLKRRSRDKKCRVILYVGRLEKYKGVDYLIKALPKLENDVFLEIVGKGPYNRNLIGLARRLGMENRVRFSQDLPRVELLQMYTDADLFASLSRHEAYGICVAEALASGTPCIVTRSSALGEWVDDENCFGVSSRTNLEELVCCINNVMGRRVKRVKLPNWDETAEKLARLYECC